MAARPVSPARRAERSRRRSSVRALRRIADTASLLWSSPEESAMPWHFCHPQAPHKKLRLPEWYVSSLMMDRALDAVVRRVKKLDRNHDIPYLAGYSRDGKTIYILSRRLQPGRQDDLHRPAHAALVPLPRAGHRHREGAH